MRQLLATIAVIALTASCGDDGASTDGGPDTDAVPSELSCQPDFSAEDACGGDPAGTWDVVDACSDFDYSALVEEQCPGANQALSTYDVTGELTIAAGNFAYDVSGTVTVEAGIPASCVVNSCVFMQSVLGEVADVADCTDALDGCSCTLTFSVEASSAGSYSTADGIATVDDGSQWLYCRDERQLLLRETGVPEDEPAPTFLLDLR